MNLKRLIGAFLVSAGLLATAAFANPRVVSEFVPLYHAHSATLTDHFYTRSPDEYLAAVGSGYYSGSGAVGFVLKDALALPEGSYGISTLHRTLGLGTVLEHFYTPWTAEKSLVMQYLGYADEGNEGSIFTSQEHPEMVPMHRLWKMWPTGEGEHVFVFSAGEANGLQLYEGYQSDGVVGYMLPPTAMRPRQDGAPTGRCSVAYGDSEGCSLRRIDWITVPGVCANYWSSNCSQATSQIVCAGRVHVYDNQTGAYVTSLADPSYGQVSIGVSACRYPAGALPLVGSKKQFRFEYSGFYVGWDTSVGARRSVVLPATSVMTNP